MGDCVFWMNTNNVNTFTNAANYNQWFLVNSQLQNPAILVNYTNYDFNLTKFGDFTVILQM
jgi:hypothetical protein